MLPDLGEPSGLTMTNTCVKPATGQPSQRSELHRQIHRVANGGGSDSEPYLERGGRGQCRCRLRDPTGQPEILAHPELVETASLDGSAQADQILRRSCVDLESESVHGIEVTEFRSIKAGTQCEVFVAHAAPYVRSAELSGALASKVADATNSDGSACTAGQFTRQQGNLR
jgi:hypothetical protein